MTPLISIQILNWNRAEETQRAIDSALQQTYPNIEVVVIDNGSTDNSIELTQINYPNIKLIQLDKNYGCPGGRNRGIEYCSGEFIFYLDNDGVLHKEAVQKAYDIIKEDNSIGVIAGVVYDFDEPTEINVAIVPESNKQYLHTNFQGGICLHRKSIYEQVGMYPDHFMYGGEEWYLTAKLLDNGFKIIKDESIILWHKRSELARNREGEVMNAYYNKLYGAVSLYPWKYALAFSLYFPTQYYKYAKKEGFEKAYRKTFFKRYFETIADARKNRSPIGSKAYSLLMNGY